jgi:ankyrin repeat protein
MQAADTDVNATDAEGRTLLHYAVAANNPAAVRMLFDAREDIDPNIPDAPGKTPLDYAKENNNQEIIQVLTSKDAAQ